MDVTPEPPPRPARGRAGSARTGRRLAAGVAATEAVLAALGAVLALVSGLQDGSLVLGAAVAGVAGGVAYLLGEAARAFLAGRRWPTGIFVTAQLLVALVALSLGGRSLLTAADNPRIAAVTVLALVLAVAGLVGVWWTARDRGAAGDTVEGGDRQEDPPVF